MLVPAIFSVSWAAGLVRLGSRRDGELALGKAVYTVRAALNCGTTRMKTVYSADMDRDPRVEDLIDERIFEAYWAAVDHFGTTDLVLYFDTSVDVDPVTAQIRERLLADPKAPSFLTERLSQPAKETAKMLKGDAGATAFWFIVDFSQETVCTAVVAKRLGRGGTA